tara:strand:+ start:70 stop:918 length:849 start_codon:yes stop_codon:yes gene_type:complete
LFYLHKQLTLQENDMKRFMTTTAIAIVFGTSAMAEGHTAMFLDSQFNVTNDLYASDLLGARIYATEADLEGTASVTSGQTTEWDDIGEINEIILTRDGTAQSVVIGVGGFLGLGEKDVSVSMDDLRFVSDGEDEDDYFVVINASKAGITDAAPYQRGMQKDDMDDMQAAESDGMDSMMAPKVSRDGYVATDSVDLTSENLTGARVYGVSDEDVGEISKLLLTDDGEIDRAVIDVGGFLGMGERPVAVPMSELSIIRSDDGEDIRVYIDSSQAALEAQPAYEE